MSIVKHKNIQPLHIFILRVWKNPIVRQKILLYQDTHHTTSMAILWCLWHDIHHSRVHTKTLMHMIKITKQYERKYIIPVRTKRTQATKNSLQYKNLLQLEINMEIRLCRQMIRTLPHPIPQNQKTKPNINIYCDFYKIKWELGYNNMNK